MPSGVHQYDGPHEHLSAPNAIGLSALLFITCANFNDASTPDITETKDIRLTNSNLG